MGDIPSEYWMVIFGLLTGFFCFVLYQIAMLLKESQKAVGDGRKIIRDTEETLKIANGILTDVNEMVSTVKGTVYQVNDAILVPLNKIKTVLGVASGLVEGFGSRIVKQK